VLVAAMDPKIESVFLAAALVCYVFAAVGGIMGYKRQMLSVGLVACGLALWHFPQLLDQIDNAY
jgi:uncharacterized membrane protein (UPF0136 family)